MLGRMDPNSLPASGRPALRRPDGTRVRALVVDADAAVNELVATALRFEEWEVTSTASGGEAVRLARDFQPDIVVLEVALPDMSGLEVVGHLHAYRPELPVLFLTGKDTVRDRIAGLTAGGDDYVCKPFSIEELIARLRGLLRRVMPQGSRLVAGDLMLDEETREVERAGVRLALTVTEFELLRFFMRNPRRVLSKRQILERVWQYDFGGRVNVVELYVSYLRRKVDAGRPPMIHTVRGAGYVLRPPQSPPSLPTRPNPHNWRG
jgi:two-component system, OmpR family, response regulator